MTCILKVLTLIAVACSCVSADQKAEILSASSDAFSYHGDSVIRLTSAQYERLAISKPKRYHLFIAYTANMHVCRVCKPIIDQFEKAALAYRMAGKIGSVSDKLPIFFAVVDVVVEKEVAKLHNVNTLPHIVHANGWDSEFHLSPVGIMQFPTRRFNIQRPETSAQDILDWVNSETGNDVGMYYTPVEKATRVGTVLGIVALGILVLYKLIMLCRRKPSAIAVIALIVHYVATSGIFYNLLHGMSLVGTGPGGTIQFIFAGPRGQFLGEGMTMSALTVTSGITLFAAARLPYTEFARKADPNKLAYSLLFLVGVSAACVYIVLNVYVIKVGWYSEPSMFPPPWYRRGPLRVDQGNAF